MGRVRRSRTHGSSKSQGKIRKTKRYGRDLDQIQQDMLDPSRRAKVEGDLAEPEDTSGFGVYPCVACDRHFINAEALKGHQRTKPHKKRLKALAEPAFTPQDADLAAGRGVDNRQRPARSANEDAMQI